MILSQCFSPSNHQSHQNVVEKMIPKEKQSVDPTYAN